jgi:hypothetical protein
VVAPVSTVKAVDRCYPGESMINRPPLTDLARAFSSQQVIDLVHREDAEKPKQKEDYPKSKHSEDNSSDDGEVRSV